MSQEKLYLSVIFMDRHIQRLKIGMLQLKAEPSACAGRQKYGTTDASFMARKQVLATLIALEKYSGAIENTIVESEWMMMTASFWRN